MRVQTHFTSLEPQTSDRIAFTLDPIHLQEPRNKKVLWIGKSKLIANSKTEEAIGSVVVDERI